MSGEHVMGGDEMIVFAVCQGADQGEPVGPRGQTGQMLANPQAGHARGNGQEFAPNLGGRVWLGVEGVQMARRPGEEDEDDRPWPSDC